MSSLALASLTFPSSPLRHIWRINPRARHAFVSMGPWAHFILVLVAVVCLFAAIGVWRRSRWGYALAVSVFTVNLIGDAANLVFGNEPRAVVGVFVVLALLAYLTRPKVRALFLA